MQEVFSYAQSEESRCSTMLHPSSQTQSALLSTFQCNSKGDFRSRDSGRVANATLDGILGKLVGDSMVVLPKVEGVAQVEELGLRPIVLPW